MGDVSTHADIMAYVTAQARRVLGEAIPEADYTYLELGNLLTDLSQFRDPTAYHAARIQALAQVLEQHGRIARRFFGYADSWGTAIFGHRSGPRHGALPEFLADFMRGAVHLLFDTDGIPSLGTVLGLAGVAPSPLVIAHGIPPGRVGSLLQRHYTQYFPHEHLDFPPTRSPAELSTSSRFQPSPRGLIGYLEGFTNYLVDELTQLEEEWVRTMGAGLRPEARQEFLLRLGHLMHPVEDFFFHSNQVELYQWRRLRRLLPDAEPETEEGLHVLLTAGLAGTVGTTNSLHHRRKFHRRLRYPVWDGAGVPSTTDSTPAVDLVYTGGFGQTDMWHTLGGVLEGVESMLPLLPSSLDPRTTNLVLFRLLLSRAAREDMVRNNTSDALMAQHRSQLQAGLYEQTIQEWERNGLLCSHAAQCFTTAFTRDRDTATAQGGFIFDFPGPGAVLITMLELMQRERTAAAAALRRLNRDPSSLSATATNNGSGEEVIGTHSLLSKDSTDKGPMRPEAVALAKHASAGLSLHLLKRVHTPTPIARGLDWHRLVRFYLRAPVSGGWETELLGRIAEPSFQQPNHDDLTDQFNGPLLGPGQDETLLQHLREGRSRELLEEQYRRLEQ